MIRRKNNKTPNLFNPKAAGRPRLTDKKLKNIRRETRESIPRKTPVHVTVKLKRGTLRTLRNKKVFKQFRLAVQRAREKGLRILHFSVQTDHIHLLIEARDKSHLGRGMQSFSISLAMSLKKLIKNNERKGIFKDRYHVHILRTPTEVKHTVRYIAGNGSKHGIVRGSEDPFSSAVLLKFLKLNFTVFFDSIEKFRKFKRQVQCMTDPPEYWLSRQMA